MNTTMKLAIEGKTIDTADSVASEVLKTAKKRAGMIPNMYAAMANNPALIDGYTYAYASFRKNGGFSAQEQEVILLSMSYENGCEYCMAAHSLIADKVSKLPEEVTNAIRMNLPIADEKLKALSDFSKAMIIKRGHPSTEEIDNFLNAGYTQNHILGIISAAAIKTMSNYTNHIFDIPVDKSFASRYWEKP